jgi:hypothetical protein
MMAQAPSVTDYPRQTLSYSYFCTKITFLFEESQQPLLKQKRSSQLNKKIPKHTVIFTQKCDLFEVRFENRMIITKTLDELID